MVFFLCVMSFWVFNCVYYVVCVVFCVSVAGSGTSIVQANFDFPFIKPVGVVDTSVCNVSIVSPIFCVLIKHHTRTAQDGLTIIA